MGRFSDQYIDELLGGNKPLQLAEISAIICGSACFNLQATDYGLPVVGFVYVEVLTWFAQAIRSSVWTYYEATPLVRQETMLSALRRLAPPSFSDWYERGMREWTDEERIRVVDSWLEANDEVAQKWLRNLLAENRNVLRQLT